MAIGSQPKVKRNQNIVKYKDEKGMTLKQIAKMMQISEQRVHQIYHREKKKEEKGK